MAKRDFVAEIVGLVAEIGAVQAAQAGVLETQIRQRFGGERVAILPTPPPDRDAMLLRIDQGLRAKKPVAKIAGELGVSRVTVYRLLKCRSPRKQ